MPSSYDDTRGPEFDSGWLNTSDFDRPDREKVNVWLTIYPSPRSMGMGDAYEVPEAWRQDGKWFHVHDGKEAELYSDYVTHWRPVRETAGSPPEQLRS